LFLYERGAVESELEWVAGRQTTRAPAEALAAAEASRPSAQAVSEPLGLSTESVRAAARVNVTCVTPLGEEVASIS
jgi:hypothetical protein